MFGDVVDWGIQEMLTNSLLYVTQMANWSGKGAKPQMLPIPEPKSQRKALPRVSVVRMKQELARWRAGEKPRFD